MRCVKKVFHDRYESLNVSVKLLKINWFLALAAIYQKELKIEIKGKYVHEIG